MAELNRYGFQRTQTLTELINKHDIDRRKDGLYKDERLLLSFPRGGLKSKLRSMWLFFCELESDK